MSGATFHKGTSKQDYETDPQFIQAVNRKFGPLSFDLAATRRNSQCGEYFMGPGSNIATNALTTTWDGLNGILWLNPPYDSIATWAKKCSEYKGDGRIFFLVPASVGSNWFAELVYPNAHTILLNGRLTFVGEKHPFPKDCMLCEFRGGRRSFELWRWKAWR